MKEAIRKLFSKLFFALLIVLSQPALTHSQNTTDDYLNQIETLKVNSYNSLLSFFISRFIAYEPQFHEFKINQKCARSSNCLSFYVLDGAKLRTSPTTSIKRLAQDNFIALSDNILLIDEYLLGEVILQTHNHFLAFVVVDATLNDQDITLNEAERQQRGNIISGSRNYLRADNLAMTRLEHDYRFSIQILSILNEFVQKKEGNNKVDIPLTLSQIDMLMDTIGQGLAFMFFHEFGHLQHNTSGAFDFSWDGVKYFLKEKLLSAYIKQQEIEADNYAIEKYKIFLQNEDKRHASGWIMMNSFAQIHTFRTLHYLKLFENFRGLPYRDLFFALFHKPCEEFVEVSKDYSNSPKYKPRPNSTLNDINYIYDVQERDILLITPQEYAHLRSILLSNLAGTHPYAISRGTRLLDALEEAGQSIAIVRQSVTAAKSDFLDELRIIEALRNNSPKDMEPKYNHSKVFSVTSGEIFDTLTRSDKHRLNVEIEDAINCSSEKCFVAKLSNGGIPFAYLEVASSSAGTFFVHLYAEMPLLDFLRPDATYSEAQIKEILLKRLFVDDLLSTITGIQPNDMMRLTSTAVMQGKVCGGSGIIEEKDDRTVQIVALSKPNWIRFDVVAR